MSNNPLDGEVYKSSVDQLKLAHRRLEDGTLLEVVAYNSDLVISSLADKDRTMYVDQKDLSVIYVSSLMRGSEFSYNDPSVKVPLAVNIETGKAVADAIKRSMSDGVISATEAKQLHNLRAYINNHSDDRSLDAREQNIIIQRANNISPLQR